MKTIIPILILVLIGFPWASFAAGKQLSLSDFLEKVEAQSPGLAIEKANIESAEARASGIRLNPPMIGYMQMKDGSGTNRGYELSQEIPFPTKISKDKEIRNLESESQKEMSQVQRLLVLADARVAYLSFWSAFSKLEIQKEKLEWLKEHIRLTRSSSWSDTSAKSHLLETESESDLLENDVLSTESELIVTRVALRNFAPDLNTSDVVPVEPAIPQFEVKKETTSSTVTQKEKELAFMTAREDFKKQAYLPDFVVRIRSFNGNETTPQSQELMVGISLPFLFFWQPKAEIAEASAQKLKAQAELQKSKIDFEIKVSSLTKKLEINQKQLKNLKEKLIPRSERRMKLVNGLSTRTMEGLDQHRSAMLGQLDLKMKAIDLRLEFERGLQELLKLGENTSRQGALK